MSVSLPARIDALIDSISDSIKNWSTRRFLLTLVVIQVITHIPITPLPPMGQHTWRQVMSTSTARNFYEDNNSFFFPSQDVRVAPGDKGIIYFQLPLLSYITGLSYHLTGFHHANSRIVILLMGIALIFGSYRLSRSLGNSEIRARWFTFFLSFSPFFFYYSITVCPNMPALTWFVWGLALIIPKLEERSWNWQFWLGIFFILLGTLSKATYLFFGLPVAYYFLRQFYKDRNLKIFLITAISAMIVAIPNVLLYLHSRKLYDLAPWERQNYTILWPNHTPDSWADIVETLRPAIFDWFLQMHVNAMNLPFFIVGCYAALKFRKWRSQQGPFWVLWLASFGVFSLLFFTQYREHAYYLTPLLILAAMGSAYGIEIWLKSKRFRWLIVLLLILTPIVMVGRVGHRWLWAKQVPVEFLEEIDRFQEVIPENERVLVFGDASPVVYLYYLHRKGVVLHNEVENEKIDQYYKHGFRYIVTELSIDRIGALKNRNLIEVRKIGAFGIYRMPE